MQVFSQDWFRKHQVKLLWFANTYLGKIIFDIPQQHKIISIAPGGYSRINSVDAHNSILLCTYQSADYNKYANRLAKYGFPFWALAHAMDYVIFDHQVIVPNFGFSTWGPTSGPAYPYRGTVNSQSDGYPGYTYTELRNGEGHSLSVFGSDMTVSIGTSTVNPDYYAIRRGFTHFDTSGLPNYLITIDSATLEVYCESQGNDLYSSPYYSLVYPNVSSVGSPVGSDWTRYTTTRLASDILYGATSDWWTFTLNSTGLSSTYLNRSGYSQYGIRLSKDTDNSEPTWKDWEGTGALFNSSKLTINYTYQIKINISDVWKDASEIYININDSWKTVSALNINISDVWKNIGVS